MPASFTRTAKSLLGTSYTTEPVDRDKGSPKHDAEPLSFVQKAKWPGFRGCSVLLSRGDLDLGAGFLQLVPKRMVNPALMK